MIDKHSKQLFTVVISHNVRNGAQLPHPAHLSPSNLPASENIARLFQNTCSLLLAFHRKKDFANWLSRSRKINKSKHCRLYVPRRTLEKKEEKKQVRDVGTLLIE